MIVNKWAVLERTKCVELAIVTAKSLPWDLRGWQTEFEAFYSKLDPSLTSLATLEIAWNDRNEIPPTFLNIHFFISAYRNSKTAKNLLLGLINGKRLILSSFFELETWLIA